MADRALAAQESKARSMLSVFRFSLAQKPKACKIFRRLALCVSAARGFGLVSLTLRPDARPLSPREHTSAQATGPSTSAYALLKDHQADALRVFVYFSSPKFNLQALASLAHLPPPQRERRLAALLRLRQHVRARVRATDERGLSVELKVLFDGTQEELTVS